MNVPKPTPIFRLLHRGNLEVCLQRGGFHAPNHVPDDDLPYKTIHNLQIQEERHQKQIPCGVGGTVHDYVPFYFGPRSPMLLQLHTAKVISYEEGQEPLIYFVTTIDDIIKNNLNFVFSDGHGIAAFTSWFEDLAKLSEIDWTTVYADYWADTIEDMDRQRRKQAEFLVHQFCPFNMVTEIGVLKPEVKKMVENILKKYQIQSIPVNVHGNWYY